jgi:hypothetical protein
MTGAWVSFQFRDVFLVSAEYRNLRAPFILPTNCIIILSAQDAASMSRQDSRTRKAVATIETLGHCYAAGPKQRLLRFPAPQDNAAMQTEPTKADLPKRELRWCQFSLRTLIELGSRIIHCGSIVR